MRLGLVLAVAACTPDVIEARRISDALAPDVNAVAKANTAFGWDVLAQLESQPAGNLFFSPFSISTALSMVDAGAAGNTDAQLRSALHATLPTDRQNAAYGGLLTSLEIGGGYGGYTLALADRLFGQTGFDSSRASWRRRRMTTERSSSRSTSATPPRSRRSTAASQQTDGKIPALYDASTLDAATVLAMVNAIYFKGTWDTGFDPATLGPFRLLDGTTAMVPRGTRRSPMS